MRTKGAWREWRVLPRALSYLRPYRRLGVVSIVLTLFAAIISLAEPWPLAIMIDSVLGHRGSPALLSPIFGSHPGTYVLLIFAASLGFVLAIFGGGLQVVTEYVNTKLDQKMVLDLRSDLFEHCQRLSLTFHDSTLTGKLMSRINLQANALGSIIMAFPPLIQSGLTVIGMFLIAFLIDWQVALISLIAVPFIYYSLGLYGTRIVPQVRKVMNLETRSLAIVHEAMGMLRVIVSFGRESYEHHRFRSQAETALDARVKLTVRQTAFSLAVTAATAAGTGLVLGFGAWHVLQGKISVGELTVLISYIASVYKPLEEISSTVGALHQQFVYLNASLKLLDTEPEVREPPDAVSIERAKGDVAYENVHFAYEGREGTLKDISFEARQGQRVAIVGPTGAGKTSLVSLLIRLYDPKEGRVLIDGLDIKQMSLKSLRNQISVVMQEPLLFSSSIATNIQYGKLGAEMDEIVEAAQAANAHDFITELPKGYDTTVGERGAQLSGGERQRISIARAFIKDAPILILDEPTSSIDSRTEGVILDALDELMVGRTSFLIAHRLATIRGSDLILVLNHGELAEQGSPEELLARGGLYRQLYDAQTMARVRPKSLQPGGIRGEVPAERTESVVIGSNGGREQVREQPVESATQDGQKRVRTASGSIADGKPLDGSKLADGGEASENGSRRTKGQPQPSEGSPAVKSAEDVACDLCGRILLKGERAILFRVVSEDRKKKVQKKERKWVCEPCAPKARDAGWRLGRPPREKPLVETTTAEEDSDAPPASVALAAKGKRDAADQ
jgi:ATP-binding cassette subfamily B protein